MRAEFVAALDGLILYADRRGTLLDLAPEWNTAINAGVTEPDQPCWLMVAPSLPRAVAGVAGRMQTELSPPWWRELQVQHGGVK